ncbi:helix-turn-helix transcriptional regulator [Elizabethkingia anophelis]|uniref:helix-turn-helix domain-containing protein n=1 Tax=Elizabethkingia anophelis TaxID=1117645 RepID=UPI0020B67492|nr:helix-turn-helix transcriptional regulator [Elizabethkingia anophelis]UTG61519.1 helix-turn-helix transcriptional regulator [Elizabethkingia anophelis]UXM67762.1 helix-turn-helix domain-containing protein [Elizabethkingia anophelis]
MIHTDMPNKKIHQGRNIKRFREMLGIKQDALAYELGEDWNQKKISLLEQKESVEKDILEQVAKILKVPTEAIENFDEEQAVNIIANTFSLDNGSIFNAHNTNPIFNPVEAVLKMHEEKIALYERMLKEKDDMMVRLEKLIEKK